MQAKTSKCLNKALIHKSMKLISKTWFLRQTTNSGRRIGTGNKINPSLWILFMMQSPSKFRTMQRFSLRLIRRTRYTSRRKALQNRLSPTTKRHDQNRMTRTKWLTLTRSMFHTSCTLTDAKEKPNATSVAKLCLRKNSKSRRWLSNTQIQTPRSSSLNRPSRTWKKSASLPSSCSLKETV